MINVQEVDENTFQVTVEENDSSSQHTVTVDDQYYQRLTAGQIGKEELVKRSFEFLLQREPKESILSRFNLTVIKRYFPSYEDEISV